MEILEKIEQLRAELDSLRPIDAEIEARIMQKLRLDWNYHSNKLEGNTYSYRETKMLLMKGLTAGGKPIRDHEEITGHDQAITFIIDSIEDDEPLTEAFIRHLHKLILVKPFWADAKTADGHPTKRPIKVGEYKTEPNHVETQSGAIFRFAEPIETPAKMQELVEWFREKVDTANTNAILLAAEFHYRFVRIHPFDDGNGRLARLLMNFVLMKYGFPPVIIKNEDKDNYIAVLEQADFNILKPFVEYVAKNLSRSIEIMTRGAKGEDIEEPEDVDKELTLLERNLRFLNEDTPTTKTSIIILELFDNSLVPLITHLLAMCRKFNKFYRNKNLSVMVNGHSNHKDENDAVEKTREYLISSGENLFNFRFQYIHSNLQYDGFENVAWISGVNIGFELTHFILDDDYKANYLKKPYGYQLTPSEIAKIVDDLAKLHTSFVKNTIGDVQKKVEEVKKDAGLS